jgi:hypothetical protein
MIHIISTFYISNYSSHLDNLRSQELETSFINNLSNEYIEKIHLFIDDDTGLNRIKEISNHSDKVVVICVGKKPKYSDFFDYIINNIKDKICMITNADIYLNKLDLNLIDNLNYEKVVYALTRYEYDMSHPLINNYGGSHDCYIFHSKFLSMKIINQHTDFFQNFPGIESHIIKSFHDDGFKIYNPCFQIQIVHLHKTELRNHGQWIGLHSSGDWVYFKKSCWWVPPVTL